MIKGLVAALKQTAFWGIWLTAALYVAANMFVWDENFQTAKRFLQAYGIYLPFAFALVCLVFSRLLIQLKMVEERGANKVGFYYALWGVILCFVGVATMLSRHGPLAFVGLCLFIIGTVMFSRGSDCISDSLDNLSVQK